MGELTRGKVNKEEGEADSHEAGAILEESTGTPSSPSCLLIPV